MMTKPQPQVGDQCCADPEEEGVLEFGIITSIDPDTGLATSDLVKDFCGDIPTVIKEGIWVFTAF